jgi:serine/threonine protein kinase
MPFRCRERNEAARNFGLFRGRIVFLTREKAVFKRDGEPRVKISSMLGSSRSAPPTETVPQSPLGEAPGAGLSGAGKNRRGTRYEVQERLGEGALWIAYRVRPAVQNGKNGAPKGASLALKALRGAANRHPRLPAALDVQTARWHALSHPHLASPLEWGLESGTYYFTAPLLSGGSLQSRLARGPLQGDEAMQVLRSLASALAYLHGQNIVHGDVRPRQVLFDFNGFAVLTDGGQAEALSEAGLALADLQPDAALYLAPERGSGSALAAPADIYSLGATFYAALTGRAPFEGNSPLAVAARHRNETPAPPSSLNPRVPREWDILALRLLAKNPTERPSAAELQELIRVKPDVVAPAPLLVAEPLTPLVEEAALPVAVAPLLTVSPVVPAIDPITVNVPKRQPIDDRVQQTLDDQDEQTQKRTRKRDKKRHGWREFRGMVGAVFCLLLLLGGGVGAAVFAYNTVIAQIPKPVIVPKYLNLSQSQAKQALAKAGLSLKVVRESYDPKKPVGTIMEGDPEAGREVRSRREVLVTVSAGEAPIKMVDFSQLTLDQARTIILQHGMKLGSIAEQYDEKTPRGAILGQFPQPGDPFTRAQPITLIVSRGPQPKEIDARQNEFAAPDPLEDAPAAPNAPFDTGDTFAPLEPATGAPQTGQTPPQGADLETRSALVRVTIPKGGGAQLVRILVSDAKGERTVYQKARRAGTQFQYKVTVTRSPDQQAQVRVFIADQLATEQQF